MGLDDRSWRTKYTSDHDLVREFYVPALERAVRYDRTTGYFRASALALVARGVEGLVRNGGRMRLIVGLTLDAPEVEAIERGTALRDVVAGHIANCPLVPPDEVARDALELLAWMVEHRVLDVKVAIRCDRARRPVAGDAIFHEKAGVLEDSVGHRLAFSGSVNESAGGWLHNWESFHVFTDWDGGRAHVDEEEQSFAALWADKATRVLVVDVPTAARADLLRFLPEGTPKRLLGVALPAPEAPPPPEPLTRSDDELRRLVWGFIQRAPTLTEGGERVGEATSAVVPWPHQVKAFERMYRAELPRLLIADEVGLGKTIQAGMLVRQMWLAGRARRVLVMAPRAVLKQWQIELREKFNLDWPVYDGSRLTWYEGPARRGAGSREVARDAWHHEPAVLVSSQLMRRQDRARELLDASAPWDLVVLDEAHHARRRSAGGRSEGGPNQLLRLMRGLRERTQGLILLTATPMQIDPVEVWDLLSLLGLPSEWSDTSFADYFAGASETAPSHETFERLAALFGATERFFGAMPEAEAARLAGSAFTARKILRALRDRASLPRRELREREQALRILRAHTPVSRLVSRHTRQTLRQYNRDGKLDVRVAERRVEDLAVALSDAERRVYKAVEDYISATYDSASVDQRNAVGFVMTIYRRRLASSFHALRQTLEQRRRALGRGDGLTLTDEDASDDEAADEAMDADEATALGRRALVAEERAQIDLLLDAVRRLPEDSKLRELREVLGALDTDGHRQAIVFTQYTDTMDFLRDRLTRDGRRVLCFSGRGGERWSTDGRWVPVSREATKRSFRQGEADLLLCTDAAAEGLNFQFCGSLVNYDMPWNPMRVEQRIGRIDRLGQRFETVRVVNLHYADTVETDVYLALRRRISLFESVVGRLQPILARLPRSLADVALSPSAARTQAHESLVARLESEVAEAQQQPGFDLDAVTAPDIPDGTREPAAYTMDDLDLVIRRSELLPAGTRVRSLQQREYAWQAPGMAEEIRVTTDPTYFEQHPESVELWSPGSALFPTGDDASHASHADAVTLNALLAEDR